MDTRGLEELIEQGRPFDFTASQMLSPQNNLEKKYMNYKRDWGPKHLSTNDFIDVKNITSQDYM